MHGNLNGLLNQLCDILVGKGKGICKWACSMSWLFMLVIMYAWENRR